MISADTVKDILEEETTLTWTIIDNTDTKVRVVANEFEVIVKSRSKGGYTFHFNSKTGSSKKLGPIRQNTESELIDFVQNCFSEN